MESRKKLILGGAVAAGLMLGGAALVVGIGLAHGDTGFDPSEYLTLIHDDRTADVVAWRGDGWLLNEGEGSCVLMRQGYSHAAVKAGIRADAGLPENTWGDIDIIAAAETALCPDQALPGVAAPGPYSSAAFVQRGGHGGGHHR